MTCHEGLQSLGRSTRTPVVQLMGEEQAKAGVEMRPVGRRRIRMHGHFPANHFGLRSP
ncbi:hypothetical protein [Candidatus Nitrospira bockiana]